MNRSSAQLGYAVEPSLLLEPGTEAVPAILKPGPWWNRGGFRMASTSILDAGRRDPATGQRARRLVVVSNRVADPDQDRQAGGLAVALEDVFRARRGLWFGWSGRVREDAGDQAVHHRAARNVDLATLDLSPKEYEECYLGYANRCLWPILHYRTDLVEYRGAHLDTYQAVSRRFARALSPLLREDDLVWVHDYHFFPLARELRRLGHRQAIGFFLHVPFPPKEVFAALPGHEAILRDLAAYDLVGFQTESDLACFRSCVEALAGGRPKADGRIEVFGRTVGAGAFPVGIDVDAFAALAVRPQARRQAERLANALQGRDQIIGVDRLDYTKGIPQRFAAYRRLLEDVPDLRGRISLLQIAPPTRQEVEAYSATREELNRLSGAINGAFADFDWTPIRYHVKPVARSTLAALFRASRVGLVTPLRDGMNLVAKEFVAAQDPADPGVLVLSRFAGAAETMSEALIVNPHDIDATAAALRTALAMSPEERRERHQALLARIRTQDATAWQRGFLADLIRREATTSGPDYGCEDDAFIPAGPALAQVVAMRAATRRRVSRTEKKGGEA